MTGTPKRLAELAHIAIWEQGRFDTVGYEVQPVFEPTSPLRFIVWAKYTIEIEGETFRSEGPLAAFVHKEHAELFLRSVMGPYAVMNGKQKQMG